jgi:putative flippase GtrA
METTIPPFSKKDLYLGILSGLFIGLLALPVIGAAKPDLYAKIYLAIVPFFLIATPFGLVIGHMIGRKISFIWQLSKFGVTGVLNALVDLGTLSILTFFFRAYYNIDSKDIAFGVITFYSIYKSASFIIANINSYFWNKHWTFHQEDRKGSEFLQFFIVSIIGFAINVIVASLIFESIAASIGISADQAGLIGAVVGSVAGLAWNFIGYKFLVFKK